jgi:pimeloyl-ACP methyl ester carboxylesterase
MIASRDGFRHRQVAVGDAELHVVEAGDPDGRPFVFLHGWPESWRSWEQLMTAAAGQVRAIAIDLPGVGQSAGAATDGSKGQLADTVHQILSVLG